MEDHKFETLAIRTRITQSRNREHSAPLYLTSSFTFDSARQAGEVFAGEQEGQIYSRFSNPNTDELVQKMCLLEGAEDGVATASGMAAVFGSLAPFLRSGDHVVASRSLFGSTLRVLNETLAAWQISTTFVDPHDFEAWEQAIRPNTRMIVVETPANPTLQIVDLNFLSKLAKGHNLILSVDNCFATPYLQQPVRFGADLVVHSATKYIDGQGRVLGGLVLGRRELIEQVRSFARQTGPCLSPFNAWILSKSLETLAVRMDRHCDNALSIANYLRTHRDVQQVNYPHLPSHPQYGLARKQMRLGGGLLTFELPGGIKQAQAFLDALRLFSLTSNLGDTRSIATHPASTTHAQLSEEERLASGITPGLIRLSVGLEHREDLMSDIDRALQLCKRPKMPK